jgi:hypothetical protein
LIEKLELVVDQFRKAGQAEHLVVARSVSASQPSGDRRIMARTLDFRIEGVPGEAIGAFCKTLLDATCKSSSRGAFVRMELRGSGMGHAVDGDPAAPPQGAGVAAAPPSTEPRGKLAPLPDADRPAAASMVKPADSEHFL